MGAALKGVLALREGIATATGAIVQAVESVLIVHTVSIDLACWAACACLWVQLVKAHKSAINRLYNRLERMAGLLARLIARFVRDQQFDKASVEHSLQQYTTDFAECVEEGRSLIQVLALQSECCYPSLSNPFVCVLCTRTACRRTQSTAS